MRFLLAFVFLFPSLASTAQQLDKHAMFRDMMASIEKIRTLTFTLDKSERINGKMVPGSQTVKVHAKPFKTYVLVHVPEAKAVFTGDILFIEGTPIMWAGPVSNWIAACDRIIAMDVDVIVPGHGPLTDKAGVREVADYLAYIDSEARARHAAGLSAEDAARDIGLGRYATWKDAERIAVNVDTLYREYNNDPTPPDAIRLFGLMGQIYYDRR